MKLKSLITVTSTLLLAAVSTLSIAAGSHAGGHHGEEGAIGSPGKTANAKRTVAIDMTDNMRFTPSNITAKKGETIKFVVKNSGKIKHEIVFGTPAELKEHYAAMLKFPDMEHADDNQITVMPGKTGEIVWEFSKAGKVDFACLQAGHFDAGMVGAVMVDGKGMTKGKTAAADSHGDQKH